MLSERVVSSLYLKSILRILFKSKKDSGRIVNLLWEKFKTSEEP